MKVQHDREELENRSFQLSVVKQKPSSNDSSQSKREDSPTNQSKLEIHVASAKRGKNVCERDTSGLRHF